MTQYKKINLVYFSATGTTRQVVSAIAEGMHIGSIQSWDITWKDVPAQVFGPQEITLFGVPVYSGRIPQAAVQRLNRFSATGSPALVVCVYGNRDFEDALLELKELVEKNGFNTISGAAFVAQHSIFPQVGRGRPDAADLDHAKNFGEKSLQILDNIPAGASVAIKGNYPYRAIGAIP